MKKYLYSIVCLILAAGGLAFSQSPDAVPAHGTIEIQVRGIPADDAAAISGWMAMEPSACPSFPPGRMCCG